MESRVRYRADRRKWQAVVRYRNLQGKRTVKSRFFETEEAASYGLKDLLDENLHNVGLYAEHLKNDARNTNRRLPYKCPGCKSLKLFSNRRHVRIEGVPKIVCISCFKKKPEFNRGKAA